MNMGFEKLAFAINNIYVSSSQTDRNLQEFYNNDLEEFLKIN